MDIASGMLHGFYVALQPTNLLWCFFGCFLGTVVGIVLSQLVAYFAGWSTIVSVTSVAVACVVSVSIGIVFGLYPAMRAAELDPVRALHYE